MKEKAIKDFCDYLNAAKNDYELKINLKKYASEILNLLKEDRIEEVYSKSKNDSDRFRRLLHSLLGNQEQEQSIIDELWNKTNLLLGDDELRANATYQMEQAELVISRFVGILDEYIKSFENDEKYQEEIDKINSLLECFADGKLTKVIPDFAYLHKQVRLAANKNYLSDSIEFLLYILDDSNTLYEEIEKQSELESINIIEKNRKEVEEKTIVQNPELEKLDRIIDMAIKTKNNIALKAVISMFDLSEIAIIDDQKIKEALTIVKDYAKELIIKRNITAEESLEICFSEHNNSKDMLESLLNMDSFGNAEYNYQEVESIIGRAREFCESKHKYLLELNTTEKEKILNFMKGIYKSSNDQRIYVYETIYKSDRKQILQAATFELQILLNLVDALPTKLDNRQDLIQKVGKRITDILTTVEKTISINEKQSPEAENAEEAKLYFAGKNNERTFIEEDLEIDIASKGITNAFLPDVLNLLQEIKRIANSEETYTKTIPMGKYSNSKQYSYAKNLGVRELRGRKTMIYFVPVHNKGAIILGVYKKGELSNLEAIEIRVKNNYQKLRSQYERIKNDTLSPLEEEMFAQIEEQILTRINEKCSDNSIIMDENGNSNGMGAL